jgi:hypothetical protein
VGAVAFERARNNREARFHNAETICEEVELKISKFRKKKKNINFLSNIFQSGVINVALYFLLIKIKDISFICNKNCITAFLVIRYNFLNAQQQWAFKLTLATRTCVILKRCMIKVNEIIVTTYVLSLFFLLHPLWWIGHLRNSLFHFNFLILRQRVGLLWWGISPLQDCCLQRTAQTE